MVSEPDGQSLAFKEEIDGYLLTQGDTVNREKIQYAKLSPRQKEIYNFQKIASVPADYGLNCIKLTDDWQGADFLAYHLNGVDTLRVQLKSRLTIDKKVSRQTASHGL